MADFEYDIFRTSGAGAGRNTGGSEGIFSAGSEPDWGNINPLTDNKASDKLTTEETLFANANTVRNRELTPASDINNNFSAKNGNYGIPANTKPEQSSDSKMAKLQQERQIKQEKLTEAQNKYNEIVNGAHTEEIRNAKAACDEKQEAYLKAVDESTNPIIQGLKSQIESTENDISSTEQFIQDYTVNIEQTTTDIADNNNKLKAKNSIINSCKNKISSLKSSLSGTVDETKKSFLQNQISGFQAQLGQEEAQNTTLESIKKSLEEKKTKLENEKKTAQDKLHVLMQEKTELDRQVKLTFDAGVRKALNEYDTARACYYELMNNAEEEKSAALSELESARSEVAEVDAKITEREIEIIQEKIEEQAKLAAENNQIQMSPVTGNNEFSDRLAANEVRVEQLQNNVKEAQSELTAKENQLYNIYDGNHEEINKLKKTKDANFDSFCDSLIAAGNTELAKELKSAKQNVDKLEKTYLSKCKAVEEFESSLGAAANSVGMISQKITGLEDAKSVLDNTDRSQLKPEQEDDLNRLVNELNAELEGLTNEKGETEKIINDAQTLKRLKEERDEAREEYISADSTLTDKMKAAVNAHHDNKTLSSSMEKYTKSKTEYDNKVASTTDELTGEITTLRAKVSSLSQTLGDAEAKKLAAKYRFYGAGGPIVDNARAHIGRNEYDGSADIFWREQGVNSSSRSLPWCAAFVSYVLKQSGVQFESGDYTCSVSGLRQWGLNNGRYIDGSNASASNIKPGDVVIWKGGYFSSHTGIVSAVYPDGSYDTIEGNSSNKVCERTGNGQTGKYKMAKTTGFVSV